MNINNKKIPALAAAAIVLLALPVFADSNNHNKDNNRGFLGNLRSELQLEFGNKDATTTKDKDIESNDSERGQKNNATSTNQISNLKTRANIEIQRRIDALTAANTAVQASTRVSVTTKNILSNAIRSQINSLTALKAKIAADTDSTVLKADIKSITQSYRIFLLVLPQARITASADIEQNAASLMTAVVAKIETRINAAHAAGKDTAALTASLATIRAKISDSNAQAAAATGLVINLTPDNGDTVKAAANAAALRDARAKIQVSASDLKSARSILTTVLNGLKNLGA